MTQTNVKTGKIRPVQCKRAHRTRQRRCRRRRRRRSAGPRGCSVAPPASAA